MNPFMKSSIGWTLVVAAATSTAAAGLWLLGHALDESRRWRSARAKWEQLGADVVILHQFRRPRTSLSLSPFPPKVEMFLRMANIPYANEFEFPYSPTTGKSPWITLNGEDVSDSQIIIETLAKRFGKDLSSGLSPKERAVSRGLRMLCEDHLYWVFVIDRYVNQGAHYVRNLVSPSKFNAVTFECYRRKAVKKITNQTYCQGLLRLGRGAVQKTGIEDLEALSAFLGTKSFIMGGETPTELDCVLFGFVSCFVLTTQEGSVYKTLIEKRLTNLHQHMHRMKDKYFPDWEEMIGGDGTRELTLYRGVPAGNINLATASAATAEVKKKVNQNKATSKK